MRANTSNKKKCKKYSANNCNYEEIITAELFPSQHLRLQCCAPRCQDNRAQRDAERWDYKATTKSLHELLPQHLYEVYRIVCIIKFMIAVAHVLSMWSNLHKELCASNRDMYIQTEWEREWVAREGGWPIELCINFYRFVFLFFASFVVWQIRATACPCTCKYKAIQLREFAAQIDKALARMSIRLIHQMSSQSTERRRT